MKQLGLSLLLLWAAAVRGEEGIFERDVQPILKANCTRCHGENNKKKADLDLTSLAALRKGGESGPIVMPGEASKSKLYEVLHKEEMPPGKKLDAKEIAVIQKWIADGAPGYAAGAKVEVSQHDILPLMRLRCGVCHGPRVQEANLDLTTKEGMLRGGKSGPAMVLGKPADSLLLKKIHSREMPPNKRLIEVGVKPITKDEIAKLTDWIAQGAPEIEMIPDVATTAPDPLVSDKDRQHWAFQPPKRVDPPQVNSTLVRNPIDAFLLDKLHAKSLDFSPEADRLTLLRRVAFDLTGLPPQPEDIDRFLADRSPNAYENMVDRFLASPRYGERWARHWLDLAGYADSEGKRSQDPVRPHAWRYRDYVIRSFNSDKSYDRFLTEQLAGDELADWQNAKEVTQELMDNLVATAFLRLTPDGTGSDVVNYVPDRLDVIADEIQVFGSTVLGLTLHCARCHSHKYDPIPQRDYYRLLDVFKGAYDEHDWLRPTSVKGQTKGNRPSRTISIVDAEEKAKWEADVAPMMKELAALKQEKPSPEINKKIKALEQSIPDPPAIQALWDRGTPSPTYIYRRGDYLQPSKLVGPGVPSVLTDGKTPFVVESPYPGAKSTGRRLALARWLTQPDHPLTARVMVNRLWKQHFGTGLVATLDNFGVTGERPTHPELLDWLARAFIERGWSIKAMHRLMLTSSAYRQSSRVDDQHLQHDPENRLLSRMPLKRMEAEMVYDATLAVAGRLDETRFGPPDPVEVRKDGLVTPKELKTGWRRSIYVLQRRSTMPTLLETFDLPQMNPNCVARIDSTVASQALYLRNNGMIHELAESFADRVQKLAGKDAGKQVDVAYRLALSRPPSAEERTLGREALAELTRKWRTESKEPEKMALTTYCHTILNSAAFVYID
jgi:cytochrome c553